MIWWKFYLSDVPLDEVKGLFAGQGIEQAALDRLMEWIFDQAGLCRLAFASLTGTDEKQIQSDVPPEAIISQTNIGLTRGRPKTARWAFWAGYIIQKDLRGYGLTLTSEFMSEFIGRLLSRSIPAVEVRTIFGELRAETIKHATDTARSFLNYPLRQELSDQRYKEQLVSQLSKGLDSETVMEPMVKDGKLDEGWVKGVVETRRSILRRIKRHGLLTGRSPEVLARSSTKLAVGLPANMRAFNNRTKPKIGAIHLGKSLSVPEPQSVMDMPSLEDNFSFSLSRNDEGDNVLSLSIPMEAFEMRDPVQAYIVSVPMWLLEWQKTFLQITPEKNEALIKTREGV